MKSIYVKWVDSTVIATPWGERPDIDKDEAETFCHTIGWFIKADKHSIYIAQSYTDDQYGNVLQIPKVSIKHKFFIKDLAPA